MTIKETMGEAFAKMFVLFGYKPTPPPTKSSMPDWSLRRWPEGNNPDIMDVFPMLDESRLKRIKKAKP